MQLRDWDKRACSTDLKKTKFGELKGEEGKITESRMLKNAKVVTMTEGSGSF